MATETPELLLADAAAWARWLAEHADQDGGVWLVLANKGTVEPTSLRYDDALDEALCHGWIDGQVRSRGDGTHFQRFTPRRPRSAWSKRNVGIIERLTAAGRMRPRGLAEVERAQADGRWAAAYPGAAATEVPPDLARALAAEPLAAARFGTLSSQNRFAVLYRIADAKRPDTRAKRIAGFVAMLARGETLYPQRDKPARNPPQ